MNWSLLLMTLVPLVIFVIVDLKANTRVAIISAIASALFFLILSYFMFGEIDEIGIIEVALLVLLGLISVKIGNSKFFKFQPVVVGVLVAGFFAYCQIFSTPLLWRLIPFMTKLQPEMAEAYEHPAFRETLSRASLYMIFVFFIHAGAVAWAAMRSSNVVWIVLRAAIYPIVILTAIAASVVQRFHNS